jgi:hypothetical protein
MKGASGLSEHRRQSCEGSSERVRATSEFQFNSESFDSFAARSLGLSGYKIYVAASQLAPFASVATRKELASEPLSYRLIYLTITA